MVYSINFIPPAKFKKNNVGFRNNANIALCISRAFEYFRLGFVLFPECASDILTCCSFSDPVNDIITNK